MAISCFGKTPDSLITDVVQYELVIVSETGRPSGKLSGTKGQ